MKNKQFLTILLFMAFASCRDKTLQMAPEQDPFKVVPAHFIQKVLLESFVSESNSESVENSFLVKELEKKYGDRIIVCNFHKQDWLETPYTNDLATGLGGMSSYPRAAINRRLGINTIQNEDNIALLSPVNWEYMIENALLQEAKVSLAAETSIKYPNTGSIKLHIAHKEALPDNMRIGLYMVEDNVQSIFQQGSNDNFIHHHVMKNALTDISGDTVDLSVENTAGEIITKEYNDIELKFYHPENLYLVAFIFNYDKDFRKTKVYNAVKVKFGGMKFWNQ